MHFPRPCKTSPWLLWTAAGAAVVLGMVGVLRAKKRSWLDLPTVDHVVPERYVGVWHEIARLPNRFQAKCGSNTQAEYTLTADGMAVRNSCTRPDGSTASVTGIARVVPGSGNAKWRVSFFRPFYGSYWILALDTDYEWALVGTPDRKYLWILARAPHLPQNVLRQIAERARALGFATENLVFTAQADALYPSSYTQQKRAR